MFSIDAPKSLSAMSLFDYLIFLKLSMTDRLTDELIS